MVHSEGFPTLKIGSRIVVPKDKLREWIDANTAQKWPRYRRGGIRKRKDDRWEGHYDRAM